MSTPNDLDEFLQRNKLKHEDWERSQTPWELLEAIGKDHDARRDELDNAAQFFARTMQRFDAVHSVRWRIKDTDHLLEKIVRKRIDGSKKYQTIAVENYRTKVTDLIGLRALHLFKEDCFSIDHDLRQAWKLIEKPIAYVREGDRTDLNKHFKERGFKVQKHGAGYRSVHYVCATQPTQTQVLAEIQVRTIFEEGWSEVDHRIRYPNFSDNAVVAYFLTIFNRLAGNADEMGSFVLGLKDYIAAYDSAADNATQERDSAFQAADDSIQKLSDLQGQHAEAQKEIASLKRELRRLRLSSPSEQIGIGLKLGPGSEFDRNLVRARPAIGGATRINSALESAAGIGSTFEKVAAIGSVLESIARGGWASPTHKNKDGK